MVVIRKQGLWHVPVNNKFMILPIEFLNSRRVVTWIKPY